MGYINHEFPGNNDYDMDLGWLIKAYKKLMKDFEELLETVNRLEEMYVTIPEEIQNAVNQAMVSVYLRMEAVERRVDVTEELVREMQEELALLKSTFSATWQALRNWVVAQNNYTIQTVKTLLDDFVAENPSVICPVDGNRESVQKALFDIWNGRSLGVPVWLFDSLSVTEEMMREWRIPVWMFDRYGLLIYAFYKALWMTSPVSGEWVSVKKVTEELAALHKNGVTVQEFDAKQITVEVFDNLNVTVYDHDYTRAWFDNIGGN